MVVSQDLLTPRSRPSAVALGFFDGVHIGHRAVISAAVETARREGLSPRVFTFSPVGLAPASKNGLTLLQTEGQKDAVLAGLGVEEIVCPLFADFCSMSPEGFVRGFLRDVLRAKVLFCGRSEERRVGKECT